MIEVRFKPATAVALLLITMLGHSVAADEAARQRYLSLALQGDVRLARTELTDVDGAALDPDFSRRIGGRFDQPPPPVSGDALWPRVLSSYQRYWHRALLAPESRQSAEMELRANLGSALHDEGFAQGGDLFAAVENALALEGIYAETARSDPLWDLVAWRSERREPYQVALLDHNEKVTVAFIEGMLSWGWNDYATVGVSYAGGWVGDDGLIYCNAEAYDVTSEAFLVSYLKHEARHLADLRRFADLSDADLEYRAKLTELIHADRTLDEIANRFMVRAGDDSAHARANGRVAEVLTNSGHCTVRGCNLRTASDRRALNLFAAAALRADTMARALTGP